MSLRAFFTFSILSLLSYRIYLEYIPITAVSGRYQNLNFENSSVLPNWEDELLLSPNNIFASETFGTGTYQIEYQIDGTYLNCIFRSL